MRIILVCQVVQGSNREQHSRLDRPDAAEYRITSGAVFSMNSLFATIFQESVAGNEQYLVPVREVLPNSNGSRTGYVVSGPGGYMKPRGWSEPWEDSAENLSTRFGDMAASMTTEVRNANIRKYGALVGLHDTDREPEMRWPTVGRIGLSVIAYRIEWQWISLHAFYFASQP